MELSSQAVRASLTLNARMDKCGTRTCFNVSAPKAQDGMEPCALLVGAAKSGISTKDASAPVDTSSRETNVKSLLKACAN